MEWSLSKVMRIEGGDVTISINDLRPLLAYLDITDPARAGDLLQAARVSKAPRRREWWDTAPFKDHMTPAMRQLVQYEADATAFRYFYTLLVPGQLQTAAYTRAVIEAYADDLPEEQIRIRLESRQRRREQLANRVPAPRIYALMDESVLHRRVAGADVLAEQLAELLRLVNDGRLLIRIVPFDVPVPIPTLDIYEII